MFSQIEINRKLLLVSVNVMLSGKTYLEFNNDIYIQTQNHLYEKSILFAFIQCWCKVFTYGNRETYLKPFEMDYHMMYFIKR